MSGLPPPNALAYAGLVAVPSINRTFPPTVDFTDFNVPTVWVDTLHENAYILVSKALGVADWVMIGGTPGNLETITTPDGTVVVPSAGNIDFLNGTGFNITGAGSDITFAAHPMTITAGTGLSGGGSLNLGGTVTLSLTAPVTVPDGGTGDTSFTPYMPIVGGSTSTANLQSVSATSTAGYVLTYVSSSAIPVWAQAAPVGSFNSVNVQEFITSGTYTPSGGMVYWRVQMVGGGGGGGGSGSTSSVNVAAGGGGGGGEYAYGYFSSTTIGASQTVTCGAGGTGASGTGSSGAGGTTSLGSLITAAGGQPGLGAAGATASGNVGGTGGTGGTGGSFHSSGGCGTIGMAIYLSGSAYSLNPGAGGNSFFGGGAVAGVNNNGNAGTVGGGGSGASTEPSGGSAFSGGTGGVGVVVITEFLT